MNRRPDPVVDGWRAFRCAMTLAALIVAGGPTASWALSPGGATDPAGDADSQDIVSASAFYDAANMYIRAAFTPGKLNAANLAFLFAFDLDQNPATGTQPPATFPLGADGTIVFNRLSDPVRASVFAGHGGYSAPISFGIDSFSTSVPLSILGDDGAANFAVAVGVPLNANSFRILDFAPNGVQGLPLSTPTAAIPEPLSAVAGASGLLCLFAAKGVRPSGPRRGRRGLGLAR